MIVTHGSAWHDALNGRAERPGDFKVYEHDLYTFRNLAALYAVVLSEMRDASDTDLPDEH